MIVYDTVEQANTAEGIRAEAQGWSSPSGWGEADWGRLRGHGLPGGDAGNWLLTFCFSSNNPFHQHFGIGTLIAYEVIDRKKTGRVAVLRRQWSGATDQAELARIKASADWDKQEHVVDAPADIDRIDEILAGNKL